MKYRKMQTKNGEIEVSKLVIGSAVKMGNLSKKDLFRLFDRYVDAGGNCIDVARAYGGGSTEELIGEYLKTRPDRNNIRISTKGCHPKEDGLPRFSGADMRMDLDASLKALGRDYIDIYWIHKDEESYPVEPIIDELNNLMNTGKIGAVGCSNWHTDRIEKANQYAKVSGQQGFEMSQIQWSLAATKDEFFTQFSSIVMDEKSYDWYCANEMPVFSFSPQAQGFFSKLEKGGVESLSPQAQEAYVNPENLLRFERVKKLAEERNVPISVPVLAYLINNKLPCWAVFGATRMEMLEETLLAADFSMTPEEADALYRI
ncbi:MAG: aldo/keto reductase [Clostridiales bacterium]|nr:aldo/keto reductase [Clostridiales bacterium]